MLTSCFCASFSILRKNLVRGRLVRLISLAVNTVKIFTRELYDYWSTDVAVNLECSMHRTMRTLPAFEILRLIKMFILLIEVDFWPNEKKEKSLSRFSASQGNMNQNLSS